MVAWGSSLVYPAANLAFSVISHPLYTTVLTNLAVPNALNITGSGGSASIKGWFQASVISFLVLPSASGATIEISMPAILNNAMINSVPTM